jgi:hypothetical protein
MRLSDASEAGVDSQVKSVHFVKLRPLVTDIANHMNSRQKCAVNKFK